MPTRAHYSQKGRSILITIKPELNETAVEMERVENIVDIINSWIEAGDAFDTIPDEQKTSRMRAFMAQDLQVQISLAALLEQSKLLAEIAAGSQRIEDHGFPELQDD